MSGILRKLLSFEAYPELSTLTMKNYQKGHLHVIDEKDKRLCKAMVELMEARVDCDKLRNIFTNDSHRQTEKLDDYGNTLYKKVIL